MKVSEIVSYPCNFIADICRELGYKERHTDKVEFIKLTPVGRIHIILNEAKTGYKKRTKVEIHHDISDGDPIEPHYTERYDATSKKAWNDIQNRIYDKKLRR